MAQKNTAFFLLSGFLIIYLTGCKLNSPALAQPVIIQNKPVNTFTPSLQPTTATFKANPLQSQSTPVTDQVKDQPSKITKPIINLVYPIVDSGQGKCYDNVREIACPGAGAAFFGQDAQNSGNSPSYTDNANGTITDNITGLMWQQSPDANGDGNIDHQDKLTWQQAQSLPAKLNAAHYDGYGDWRLPTIKELYSLIQFDGTDVSSCASGSCSATPFIDTHFFKFAYGDAQYGERTIDSQYLSSTMYVNKSAQGINKLFGVNFADGRIKGYDLSMPGGAEKTFYVICVRGNPNYGINQFVDNGDQTISDQATGLTWVKTDSGTAMTWQAALAWAQQQNAADYLGHNDWRLPNAKELQSLLEYSRSPDTTHSAAIDAKFINTQIKNEAGQVDYAFYWTSTTHATSNGSGGNAVYLSFGRALGYMNGAWVDVHGAGAQRSDPKSGDPSQFPTGQGPQGDAIRILNYVRLVRGGVATTPDGSPNTTRPSMTIQSRGLQRQNQPGGASQNNQDGALPAGNPPQAAISACASSSAGAVCQFSSPRGTISGTCQQKQQLVCVPANLQQP